MLNTAEQEILNAHKYKNIKKFDFLGSGKSRMLFPHSAGKISCSVKLSMKKVLQPRGLVTVSLQVDSTKMRTL